MATSAVCDIVIVEMCQLCEKNSCALEISQLNTFLDLILLLSAVTIDLFDESGTLFLSIYIVASISSGHPLQSPSNQTAQVLFSSSVFQTSSQLQLCITSLLRFRSISLELAQT